MHEHSQDLLPGGLSLPRVRLKLIAWTTGIVIASGAAAPVADAAPALAGTGNATSVTVNQADLNGVVDALHPGAQWLFQYSPKSQFSGAVSSTRATSAPLGLDAVERRIGGLAAGTTYYWRVVLRSASGNVYGNTERFTTLGGTSTNVRPYTVPGPPAPVKPATASGRASLQSKVVHVAAGRVALKLSCAGTHGAPCRGTLAVTMLHHRRISCGAGKISTVAGRRPTVPVTLKQTCLALLSGARSHTWPAAVHLAFSTHQPALTKTVKVVGAA